MLQNAAISDSSNRGSLTVRPNDAWEIRVGGIAALIWNGGGIHKSSNSGHIRTHVQFINKENYIVKGESGTIYEKPARIFSGGIFATVSTGGIGKYSDVSNTGNISIHSVIGNMKSEIHAGGICGNIGHRSSLQNTWNSGLVNIEAVSQNTKCDVGYITGSISSGSRLISCYWLDTSGDASEISGVGYDERKKENNDSIKGLSPKEASNINQYSEWDFENIWDIPESGLRIPRLRNAASEGSAE